MKRNSAIDYYKLFFSFIVLIFHYGGLYICGGHIVVEGFFMISGFLMMASLSRKKAEGIGTPDSTARFILHKYQAFFLPLLFSAIGGFLLYDLLIYKNPTDVILRRIPLLLFEVFPLQVAGYDGVWATGVSWYLSAMMLAMAVLHPFAKKDPERFAYTVCPVLSLSVYGYLCIKFHHLACPNNWIEGLFNSGFLRAIAGIAAGCVLYAVCARSSKSKGPELPMRIVYTILEILGILFLLKVITDRELAATRYDFVLVAIQFGILYLALSKKTLFSLFTHFNWTGILSEISLYIFMNHYGWSAYFRQVVAVEYEKTADELFPWYLLCIAVTSAIVWGLTKLTRLAIKHGKRLYEAHYAKADAEQEAQQNA